MFRNEYQICRVFGIPIVIGFDVIFLVLFIALSYGNLLHGLSFTANLVGAVVLHELGHAAAARLFGARAREIRIGMLGGCAEMVGNLWRPAHRVVVALAGPFANLLLAGAIYALLCAPVPLPAPLRSLLVNVLVTNAALGVFNLVPGFPLDGGHALMAVLGRFVHRERAAFAIMCVGRGLAVLLTIPWLYVLAVNFDVGALLLLVAVVLWVAGDRLLPRVLRLWMPEGKALMMSILLRAPLQLLLAFVGFALAAPLVRLWSFNLVIAGFVWKDAYAAYREAAWHG